MAVVFSTALLPPPVWWSAWLRRAAAIVDVHEHFIRQTHRNRFRILTANGPMAITVPVEKISPGKRAVKDIRISYAEDWQRKAMQAIRSAYNNAPYYEHYEEDFAALFLRKETFLTDYNHSLWNWAASCLDIRTELVISTAYCESPEADFRSIDFCAPVPDLPAMSYTQVFRHKSGFTPHLSIIDLLFNKGPEAMHVLP